MQTITNKIKYMKTFYSASHIILLLCFSITSLHVYSQEEKVLHNFEYDEAFLLPATPAIPSDTTIDRYIVIDADRIEKLENIILIKNDKEYVFSISEILKDPAVFRKEENKVYLSICKATDRVSIYVLGTTPDNALINFSKALSEMEKRVLEAESRKPVEPVRKYDIKIKP